MERFRKYDSGAYGLRGEDAQCLWEFPAVKYMALTKSILGLMFKVLYTIENILYIDIRIYLAILTVHVGVFNVELLPGLSNPYSFPHSHKYGTDTWEHNYVNKFTKIRK